MVITRKEDNFCSQEEAVNTMRNVIWEGEPVTKTILIEGLARLSSEEGWENEMKGKESERGTGELCLACNTTFLGPALAAPILLAPPPMRAPDYLGVPKEECLQTLPTIAKIHSLGCPKSVLGSVHQCLYSWVLIFSLPGPLK